LIKKSLEPVDNYFKNVEEEVMKNDVKIKEKVDEEDINNDEHKNNKNTLRYGWNFELSYEFIEEGKYRLD